MRFLAYVASRLPDVKRRTFWLHQSFRLLAVVLAGLHCWAAATSHSMNPDGVSYLDIGDAYFRGDWASAISTIWSPLYAWILGAAMWLVEPPMRWEFPTVHVVNFLIFLLTLGAFEFMWSRVRPVTSKPPVVTGERDTLNRGVAARQVALPKWAWWSVGYLLFIWATLNMIQIWSVTPDMLMAAFVFWAAGLVAQIRDGRTSWGRFAVLGFVLGFGYLSKAIMLPVSAFCLAAAFWAVRDWRRAMLRSGVALGCLLLVVGPFVAAMSLKNHRFTYGDVSKFVYARHVNHVAYPHWQGEPPGNGVPLHPSRQVLDSPPIYEFSSPVGGTYPISFDQSYWYEGVVVRFDLTKQLRRLASSALYYADLFVHQQAFLLFGLAVLYSLRRWNGVALVASIRHSLLSGVGLLGLLLYAPILVADRYVGAFILLFWSDMLAQVRLPRTTVAQRVLHLVSVLMAFFLLANIALFNLEGYGALREGGPSQLPTEAAGSPEWPGEVAETLHALGIQEGEKVAVIGYGFDSFWARLARVQIVAEMLGWEADPFWLGDATIQSEVLQAFASTGARAVVAEHVPSYATLLGWHRVGESNYYVYLLGK